MSIEKFNKLSEKYFDQIKEVENIIIEFDEEDKEILVFILRWYYNLWIDVNKNYIEVYSSFPKVFKIINEVNKSIKLLLITFILVYNIIP